MSRSRAVARRTHEVDDDDWGSSGGPSRLPARSIGGRPAGMSDSEGDDDFDFCAGNKHRYSEMNGHTATRYDQKVKEITPFEQLRLACMNEDTSKVIQLLDDGKVSVNDYSTTNSWTALMTVAKYGNLEIMKILVERGADVNAKAPGVSGDGLTALMSLALAGKIHNDQLIECADLLLEKGANVNATDFHSMSPLMYAAKENKLELVKRLIEAGADVNHADEEGRSALELAATHGFGKIIRVLLQNDADATNCNERGLTPSEVAGEIGHTEICDILYRVETTKWRPGKDPALMNELADVVVKENKKLFVPQSALLERNERSQIEMVLENLDLREYIKNFESHKISYLNFLNFTDNELKDIGVDKVGVRMKILDAIREIHNREWVDRSVIPIFIKSDITASEVICILNNTKKHMDYISATVEYLRKKSTNNPEMLEVGIENNTIPQMLLYVQKSLDAIDGLQSEIRNLQRHLKSLQNNAQFQLADEFTEINQKKTAAERIRKFVIAGATVSVGLGTFCWVIKHPTTLPSIFKRLRT